MNGRCTSQANGTKRDGRWKTKCIETDTLSAKQVRQPYNSGTKLRDKPYSDYYAALRAWRRELLQTFFFSTVWKPSLSLGASSRTGAGDAGAGDADLTGVASPAVEVCCFAASRARHPPELPLSAPGRYLHAAGAGLSTRGGVSTPEREDGTPDLRQAVGSSRGGGARVLWV